MKAPERDTLSPRERAVCPFSPFSLYSLAFTSHNLTYFLNSSIIFANRSKRYAESCGPGEASG
jgi:hypothetical protein